MSELKDILDAGQCQSCRELKDRIAELESTAAAFYELLGRYRDCVDAREKRIAELEAEIKYIWEHCSVDSYRRQYMVPEDVIRRVRKVLEGDT